MQNTLVKVPIVLRGNQPWPSRSNLRSKSKFTPFWACPPITHQPFKLGSPNLDQRCKIHWLRFLLFWLAIDLDLQGQIWLNKSNCLASPLLEIHNHHITTREPWVPRLLHRPDCFMVSILCMYLYLDCFTVLTVSQSQHFARTLIKAAEGISAFNGVLVIILLAWRCESNGCQR